MKGLVVKYGEKTYKVGLPDGGVTLSSCIMQNKFTLRQVAQDMLMLVYS